MENKSSPKETRQPAVDLLGLGKTSNTLLMWSHDLPEAHCRTWEFKKDSWHTWTQFFPHKVKGLAVSSTIKQQGTDTSSRSTPQRRSEVCNVTSGRPAVATRQYQLITFWMPWGKWDALRISKSLRLGIGCPIIKYNIRRPCGFA